MPHVAFIAFSGLRVREHELTAYGANWPGLAPRAAAVRQLPSLGLLTLAGMLPDEWTSSYHEANGDADALLQRVANERPTIAALSALTASVDEAYQLSVRLRAENIRTVLGGLHASVCAEEAARYVDAVCIGEGEFSWTTILADAAAGRLKRKYGALRSSAPIRWVRPRFELAAANLRQRWTMQTQRGCPLACEFCAASRLLSRYREKPATCVAEELAAIRLVAPNAMIELADDNTFVERRANDPLFDVLARANVRYFTEVDWRIGEKPDVLRRMAESGCVEVLVGIESLVFRFPGMGAKADELDRIMGAIERMQEAGIAVNGCFVAGADGETLQSLERMGEFIRKSQLADVQVALNTPFPGTRLRERLAREGRLLAARGWSHYTLFDVTFQPDRMSVAELESGYRRLLATIYHDAEARRRAALRRQIWRINPALRGTKWLPPNQ